MQQPGSPRLRHCADLWLLERPASFSCTVREIELRQVNINKVRTNFNQSYASNSCHFPLKPPLATPPRNARFRVSQVRTCRILLKVSKSKNPPCMHTCSHAHMHACSHAHMHTCIHAYMLICLHATMHTCLHAYMLTCSHTYMHTCIHAYMHACNARSHAYMLTCKQRQCQSPQCSRP